MAEPTPLTGFQIEVAHLFFDIEASKGYLVAGGAALLAADLIARPTEDLDLFASTPVTSVTEAKDEFVLALPARSYEVRVLQDGATFCRMIVARERDEVLVDPGFDTGVLAQMMHTIGRFDDDEIPLPPSDLPAAKEFFNLWADELG